MNISNNNINFKSGMSEQKLEKIASLTNNDIEVSSKILASRDYKKRSDNTRALGTGLLIGVPLIDSLATAARSNAGMSKRLISGAKTVGAYGLMYAVATGFFSLVNKGIKHSENGQDLVDKKPALVASSSLLAAILVVPAATIYIANKAVNLADKVFNKIDKKGNIKKSLEGRAFNFDTKLKDGRVESALNKVGKFVGDAKNPTKAGKLISSAATLAIFGYMAKSIYDTAKFSKDTKRNMDHLVDLRSKAREIVVLNEEANTTKELSKLEMEEPVEKQFEQAQLEDQQINSEEE